MNLKLKITLMAILAAAIVVVGFLLSSGSQKKDIPAPEAAIEITAPSATAKPVSEATVVPSASPTDSAETSEPAPSATASPKESTESSKGSVFTLGINGKDVSVAYGVDEATLENGPGWLEASALPGEEGVCVVYGHRNRNHLKVLKDVEYGDSITVTTAEGRSFAYRIESIEIVNSDSELRVPTLDGSNIMISTCYPFYYTGHAPQKYVVVAERYNS